MSAPASHRLCKTSYRLAAEPDRCWHLSYGHHIAGIPNLSRKLILYSTLYLFSCAIHVCRMINDWSCTVQAGCLDLFHSHSKSFKLICLEWKAGCLMFLYLLYGRHLHLSEFSMAVSTYLSSQISFLSFRVNDIARLKSYKSVLRNLPTALRVIMTARRHLLTFETAGRRMMPLSIRGCGHGQWLWWLTWMRKCERVEYIDTREWQTR